jgi:phage N-6-adenine-methyltransferase
MPDTQLDRLTRAEQMLASIATAADAVDVIRFAEAARVFGQQARLGTSSINHATVIKMRAERRLADVVDEGRKAGQIAPQGRPIKAPEGGGFKPLPTLNDIGVDDRRLAEARKIRDNYTDEDLARLRREADEADRELSRRDLVTRPTAQRVNASGGSEHWYTPVPHIEAARLVLGGIDLDPASSDIANETVRAARYFTEDDDGLAQLWGMPGANLSVWLNPPYGEPAGRFVEKLAEYLSDGTVSAAVVLVSLHAMSAGWFEPLFHGVLCVTRGRIAFTDADGNPGSPTFGSVFAYFGTEEKEFAATFAEFGHILTSWDGQ